MAFWRRFLKGGEGNKLAACTALDVGTEFAKALVFELNPDGTTVNPSPARDTFASLEPVNISGINFTGAPTTELTFAGNLPAQLADGTPGTPIQTDIEYFSDLGNSYTLTLEWTPSADGVANHWGLRIFDSQTGGGTTPTWRPRRSRPRTPNRSRCWSATSTPSSGTTWTR